VILIFFGLTSLLAIVRYVLLMDNMTIGVFFKQYVLMLLASIFLVIGIYFIARITRFIYQEPFREAELMTFWFVIVLITGVGLFLYVASILEKDTSSWLYTTSLVPILAMILEHYTLDESLEQEESINKVDE